MNSMQVEKFRRLKNRQDELKDLNEKIGKLAFFLNESDENDVRLLKEQLEKMLEYRNILQKRIEKGAY